MPVRAKGWKWLALALGLGSSISPDASAGTFHTTALIDPAQVNDTYLAHLKTEGFAAAALTVTDSNAAAVASAARQITATPLSLDYWIEVARNPVLADTRPEWMASVQTHEEWRRLFPGFPPCPSNAVVKVYPWTPIAYQESFSFHVERVASLLQRQPPPRRLYLNGLQSGPSACGCGHLLCRWTADYGPRKTATPLPARAAADFIAAVKSRCPGVEVVPVWTTECEQEDRETVCGGVGCYGGACWREWTAQLTPVTREAPFVGVLLLVGAFDRDLPRYGKPMGWITHALQSFQWMPPKYGAQATPVNRLLPVLQGWDMTPARVRAQLDLAAATGSSGAVVALTRIDQSWSPRLFHLSPR